MEHVNLFAEQIHYGAVEVVLMSKVIMQTVELVINNAVQGSLAIMELASLSAH